MPSGACPYGAVSFEVEGPVHRDWPAVALGAFAADRDPPRPAQASRSQ